MWLQWLDMGDMLLVVAILFTSLIVLFESLERRRENRRERNVLAAIEAEYQMYFRTGRL